MQLALDPLRAGSGIRDIVGLALGTDLRGGFLTAAVMAPKPLGLIMIPEGDLALRTTEDSPACSAMDEGGKPPAVQKKKGTAPCLEELSQFKFQRFGKRIRRRPVPS